MFNSGSAHLDDTTLAVMLCKEMKWDYYTFSAQPAWFIDGLLTYMRIEGEWQKAKSRERKHIA